MSMYDTCSHGYYEISDCNICYKQHQEGLRKEKERWDKWAVETPLREAEARRVELWIRITSVIELITDSQNDPIGSDIRIRQAIRELESIRYEFGERSNS